MNPLTGLCQPRFSVKRTACCLPLRSAPANDLATLIDRLDWIAVTETVWVDAWRAAVSPAQVPRSAILPPLARPWLVSVPSRDGLGRSLDQHGHEVRAAERGRERARVALAPNRME
jgi:hypothetical protein